MIALPAVIYTVGLFFAFRISLQKYRRQTGPLIERLQNSLYLPILASLAVLFIYKILWSIYTDVNWERLHTVFAFSRNVPIYPALESGPVVLSIYGPVSVFAYLPATFFKVPTAAMWMAESLSMTYFFLPAAVLLLRRASFFRLLIFLIFCYLPFLVVSLRNAAFHVHADAPTLGLAGMACAMICLRQEKTSWKMLFGSSLFAVLAVWSKQTAAPLLVALPLYLGLTDGRKVLVRYLICFLPAALLISVIFLIVFDPQRLFFNLVVIPSRHPFRDGASLKVIGQGVWKLLRDLLLPFVFYLLAARPFLKRIWKSPSCLFILVSLLMAPLALLSNLKVGGSNNTLSFVTYFFTLGVVSFIAENERAEWTRRAVVLTSALFLMIQIPSVYYRIAATPGKINFIEPAYNYIRKYPGEAYFPRLGVLHIMAENKVYHSSIALHDRQWAGFDISPEAFRAYIPKNLRLVAFHNVIGTDMRWLPLEEFSVMHFDEDELPGYRLFKRP